eukprot:TRINITY_DN12623_c0_g1_i1.p1 TRINITY_DN12623_c0_g1~~TRINITY_DN12623_c0_g1_i1.p1  ORF type:complete len:329 (-),score=73.43 TRINITY_DN12623_c0_g1_i1:59-1045(-)
MTTQEDSPSKAMDHSSSGLPAAKSDQDTECKGTAELTPASTPKKDDELAATDDEREESDKKEDSPGPTSVQGYGVCADQNWKYRRRMEDAHYLEDGFLNNPTTGFFAVYDGHGGKEAAIYCSENFHKVLAEELAKEGQEWHKNSDNVLQVFRRTYLAVDDKLKTAVPSHHGCTSVTCLVTGKGDDRHLFSANTGDARAVLCRDGTAIRLTEEHKASDPIEAKRITDGGGFVIHGRVNGQIIITRSLGDHLMKEFIIGDPYTHYEKLTDKDTWLIVACDGLWDVVSDQQAVDFVLQNASLSASEVSKKLLIKALQDGTTDNLSIMVVKL